ncbi:MAG: hypothetical protein H6731_04915 [Myxococcales bacterium]|nr:MAG: hypothetical protein H6731_04915 [Myxococcales bacterium]
MKIIFLFFFSFTLKTQDFNTLNGERVPKVEFQTVQWAGKYVFPNELEPGLFNSEALDEVENLLVSVGTIRTLIMFSWCQNITHLLMTDIDKKIVDFNRAHLAYIKWLSQIYPNNLTAQRMHYMANFLGHEPLAEEVNEWAQLNLSFNQMQVEIQKKVLDDILMPYCNGNPFLKTKVNQKYLNYHLKFDNIFNYKTVKNQKKYYWESDDYWGKIVNAIEHQQIAVTNLNIVCDIETLNVFISQINLKIGAMDVSNIPNFCGVNSIEWWENLHKIEADRVFFTRVIEKGKFEYSVKEFIDFRLWLYFGN